MLINGILTIGDKEYELGKNLKVMGNTVITTKPNSKGYFAEEKEGTLYVYEVESIDKEGMLPKETVTIVDASTTYSVRSAG